jgi:putative Mg2+ transporter-C (MgtC) family protein
MTWTLYKSLEDVLAVLIVGTIGWERGTAGAGRFVRTFGLAGRGGGHAEANGDRSSVTGDATRIAAQVVSGIGFLGAGTILKVGVNIKGLTTAASLWATACLGLAAGAGLFMMAFMGLAIVLLTLTILERLEKHFFYGKMTAASFADNGRPFRGIERVTRRFCF